MRRAILSLFILAAGAILPGCGQSRPEPAPVTGVVTFEGKPVEGARVMFYPSGKRPAIGTTDAEGRFTLLTWEPGDGALEGEAVVCIAKTKLIDSPDSPYDGSISILPEKYMAPSKSPLRATISSAGPNEFKFDLVN